ncbi:hypothetical protein [Azospirillum soli]|uniref:hypothetical protein n=1 Tax=Azospirillum soli TaxID=1304799 RepID=UPI001AE3619C|nr:hypothetical protein [Azospirillum soli]MBP2311867.1 hypothetical protein [Azospirillum soli]
MMTAEIAVMNRRAAVLAADSAGTVTGWVNGKQEVRYFKGENKVFQASLYHPVGLMTYGNADLQRVPWELVIKHYRQSLGKTSFDNLEGYGEHLFNYIEADQDIFPNEDRERYFRDKVDDVALKAFLDAVQSPNFQSASDDASKAAAFVSFIDQMNASVDASPIPAPLSQGDIDAALADNVVDRAQSLDENLKTVSWWAVLPNLASKLAEVTIKLVFKQYSKFLSSTGIVLAGYGDKEFFPHLHQYRVYGFLRRKFVYILESSRKIGLDKPSEIVPFASTDMVDTFRTGASPDVYSYIGVEFESAANALAEDIKVATGGANIPGLEQMVEKHRSAFMDGWFDKAFDAHYRPLTRVVGMLPVDEMASLAETLINLESLKEKVTSPTESIGGAVDVAVITKAEGFVWIKRKHYFDLSLNPRYAARFSAREQVGGGQ